MSRLDKIDQCEMKMKLELSENKQHEYHRKMFLMREVSYYNYFFSYGYILILSGPINKKWSKH